MTVIETTPLHVDVLIVGAGLSGIGAACHLTDKCPGRSYAILEAREAMGGTWDLFRYPGIRSDSDMFTLGFSFKPWVEGKAIADGPDILRYIHDTAREHGVEDHIRYGHKVRRAEWSSADAQWTVEAEVTATGETVRITCGFLFGCTGYYSYDHGHTPEFPGIERFQGRVVHPQQWSDDVDYAGKRVVVIGSGATAVTLVPAMAPAAEHVTMLQRSPTYIVALPAHDPIADALRRVLPAKVAHPIIRWKNILMMMGSFQLSRRAPGLMKAALRKGVLRHLPPDYEVDKHFNPAYDPWDQRLCLVPDGDLFKVLRHGDASIVTDRIDTFTETGIRLASGRELEADLVVSATGLDLIALGGITLYVDGEEVDYATRVAYRGMMLSDVPNAALALGYTNASWTLKCELICEAVCRLLNHMDANGFAVATPHVEDASMATHPFLKDLSSGYVQRSLHLFPRQGDDAPWRANQNYILDLRDMRRGRIDDQIRFERAPARAPREAIRA
jgi:cation diffusion facilitator CzcD-associated flavoprotein CzcO